MAVDERCKHIKDCPMFAIFNLKSALEVWKIRYCNHANHVTCQRYELSAKGRPVPINLMPSGALLKRPE